MGQITEPSIYIAASARDADCVATGTPDLTGNDVICENDTLDKEGFYSFQLSNVYKDATIDTATLTITAYANAADQYSPRLYIESVNNSAVFGAAEDLTARSFWATYVTWNTTAWTAGTAYTSSSITTLIDHATGIAGWVPGNWITIKMDPSASGDKGDDPKTCYSWDYDNANGTTRRAYLSLVHTHACNPDGITGNWELNSTTGSCTMQKSESIKGWVKVLDGQDLATNGYDIHCAEEIIVKGSGAFLNLTSGSEISIEQ